MTQTALITGAATRVGKAIALHLAAQGWNVALHYRTSQKEAEAVAESIMRHGRRCTLVQADLADAQQAQSVVPRAVAALGALSLLINNAAVFEKDSLATMTPESWARHMDLNLRAPMLLAQDFAAQCSEKNTGHIINITDSCVGWSLSPNFLSYSVSKLGLAAATPLLAQAVAPHVRVNAVAPGVTLMSIHDTEETFAKLQAASALRRLSSPEEVCKAVEFLLAAPSITGHIIPLSGGLEFSKNAGNVACNAPVLKEKFS